MCKLILVRVPRAIALVGLAVLSLAAQGKSDDIYPIALTFSQQDPQDVATTFTIDDKTTTVTATVDGGCTAEGNVDGTDIPVPASQLSRDTATALGMINKDGTFNKADFETDKKGNILIQPNSQGDGTSYDSAVSKPIKIKSTDSNGKEVTITIRVTVPVDPKKPGANLIGDDFLDKAAATETYRKPRKVTWGNPEKTVPGAKKKSELILPPLPGGMPRKVWDGVTYASSGTAVPGNGFLMFESPFTMLSKNLANRLGLESTGTVDLSGDVGLLDDLERSGFYADTAPHFGIFDEALLPTLKVRTDDGSLVSWANLPVLINPVSDQSLLGFDLVTNGDGSLGGVPLAQITFIAANESTWFTPVPEPSALLLFGSSLLGLAWLAKNGCS